MCKIYFVEEINTVITHSKHFNFQQFPNISNACRVSSHGLEETPLSVHFHLHFRSIHRTGLLVRVENHFIRAIEHFFRVYIASSIKHSRSWETDSLKLCHPWRRLVFAKLSWILPSLLVLRWHEMRPICKHGKGALYLLLSCSGASFNLTMPVFCNGNLWFNIKYCTSRGLNSISIK